MKRSRRKRTAVKHAATKARPKKQVRATTASVKPKATLRAKAQAKPKATITPRSDVGRGQSATQEKYRQAGAPWWKEFR